MGPNFFIWLAIATFLAGLLLAASQPFRLSMFPGFFLMILSLMVSLALRRKAWVLGMFFVSLSFVGGHQWGSYRYSNHLRGLPPENEIGASFKIKARILRQWHSQRGLAVNLDRVEILSPEAVTFRIPRIIVYLPKEIRQVRRHSQIQTWITLKQRSSPRTIPWPMLDLWETYRPSFYGSVKAPALIEVLETTEPKNYRALNLGNQQLLALFLQGQRSQIWHDRLQPLGLGHLLAISGLHCLVVYLLIQALLIPVRKPIWRTSLTLVGLCMFGQHMGWSASVTRATLMLIVWQALPLFNRKRHSLKIWTSLLLLGAISQPTVLFSQGFWYTFSASLGILVAARPLPRSPLVHPFRYRIKPLLPLVGAQFMVLPIQLIFGIHAPLGGLFWNLFGGFFLGLLLILFTFCILVQALPFLAPLVNTSEVLVGKLLGWLVTNLPEVSLIRFPHTPLLALVMVVTLAYLLRFAGREWRWYAACGALFFFSLTHQPHTGSRTMMLDVGQGMSFLHVAEDGMAWLFDAGGSLPRRLDFRRVIRLYGGKTLGGAFISHLNWDHYQLLDELRSPFPIYFPVTQGHLFRQQAILRQNHTHISLEQGQTLEIGDLSVEVLGPKRSLRAPNTNEGSLILLVDGPWGSLLLMGDAGTWAESRLSLPPRKGPRWLQVGHHGSKTATGDGLLDRFRPQGAFISAGRNNPFGHPHPSVLGRLSKHGIDFFCTSQLGTLDLSSLAPKPMRDP